MNTFKKIIGAIKNNNLSKLKESLLGISREEKQKLLEDVGKNEWTPLHYAIITRNIDVGVAIELLLQAKDKSKLLKARDRYQRTPLHYAAQFYRAEMIEKFLSVANMELGIKQELGGMGYTKTHSDYEQIWEVKDNDGMTPLDFAAKNEDARVLVFINKILNQSTTEQKTSAQSKTDVKDSSKSQPGR